MLESTFAELVVLIRDLAAGSEACRGQHGMRFPGSGGMRIFLLGFGEILSLGIRVLAGACDPGG